MSNRIFLLPTGKLRLALNLKNPLGTLNQTLLSISPFFFPTSFLEHVSAPKVNSNFYTPLAEMNILINIIFHLISPETITIPTPLFHPFLFYRIVLIRTTNEFSTNINRHNWLIVSLPLFAYSQLPIVLSPANVHKD